MYKIYLIQTKIQSFQLFGCCNFREGGGFETNRKENQIVDTLHGLREQGQ